MSCHGMLCHVVSCLIVSRLSCPLVSCVPVLHCFAFALELHSHGVLYCVVLCWVNHPSAHPSVRLSVLCSAASPGPRPPCATEAIRGFMYLFWIQVSPVERHRCTEYRRRNLFWAIVTPLPSRPAPPPRNLTDAKDENTTLENHSDVKKVVSLLQSGEVKRIVKQVHLQRKGDIFRQ